VRNTHYQVSDTMSGHNIRAVPRRVASGLFLRVRATRPGADCERGLSDRVWVPRAENADDRATRFGKQATASREPSASLCFPVRRRHKAAAACGRRTSREPTAGWVTP
jgi:hypothetical protein